MFRQRLVDSTSQLLIDLESDWIIKIPGLVRVPFFDPSDEKCGYIVYYSEIKRSYGIVKYRLAEGDVLWENSVVNGGYGTPVVWGDYVVVLKGFSDIAAFDKNTGKEIWDIKTKHRIRSSLSIIENHLLFSSGGSIYRIGEGGQITSVFENDGVFFFGTISKRHDHYLAIGTRYSSESNSSRMYLFGLDSAGDTLFETDLGESGIISADTSGFWFENAFTYITCEHTIFKIDSNDGNILWKKQVNGHCGRHVPICDGSRLFYTTLKGNIGCLDIETCSTIWEIGTHEGFIVAPPSMIGDTLLVLADCSIYLIEKTKGTVYQKRPIGHCPYSACSIFGGKVYVGGGEPPANGIIHSFKIRNLGSVHAEILRSYEIGNFTESNRMEIVVELVNDWDTAEMDASVISPQESVAGHKLHGRFLFEVTLKTNNLSGYYCLPVTLSNSHGSRTEAINVYLFSRNVLPPKFKLGRFSKKVEQEDYLYSGAALAQMVFKEYGKAIKQSDFREMIDYVKEKSDWEDVDFQTWRLVLKRVLSNQGKNVNDLIESEKE